MRSPSARPRPLGVSPAPSCHPGRLPSSPPPSRPRYCLQFGALGGGARVRLKRARPALPPPPPPEQELVRILPSSPSCSWEWSWRPSFLLLQEPLSGSSCTPGAPSLLPCVLRAHLMPRSSGAVCGGGGGGGGRICREQSQQPPRQDRPACCPSFGRNWAWHQLLSSRPPDGPPLGAPETRVQAQEPQALRRPDPGWWGLQCACCDRSCRLPYALWP